MNRVARGLPWSWTSGDVSGARPRRVDTEDGPARPPLLLRAVAVEAPPETTWLWVRQVQVAPYSYDLLDNRGRRSPRHLLPDLGDPAVGDAVMDLFEVTVVDPPWLLELRIASARGLKLFGPMTVTYRVDPVADPVTGELDPGACVVRGELSGSKSTGLLRLRDLAFAWGDLVMMRRQLLTWARLAEQTAGGATR